MVNCLMCDSCFVIKLREQQIMAERKIRTSVSPGDVVFIGLNLDVQYLANKFAQLLQGIPLIKNFTLVLPESFPSLVSWRTYIAQECVPYGYVGHFAIKLTNYCKSNLMLGALEGTNEHSDSMYLGRERNKHGKAMYTANNSLYDETLNDRGEFNSRFSYDVGDVLGIVFDMREHNNGYMLLTKNNQVVGMMFSGLKSPMYPGVSINGDFLHDPLSVVHYSTLPLGWNHKENRLQVGTTLAQKNLDKK
jgi:hypothetical protein